MSIAYATIALLLLSASSLAGVALLSINRARLNRMLLYFVSFAVGALFANIFLHLLPEIAEEATDVSAAFGLVLLGLVLTFIVEKFIHWHHCHSLDCDHAERPIGPMILIGDGVHNIVDGILITSTFLVSPELGIATTFAIILHEIPQEIGDFAVLLHSGFTRRQALLWNFVSALMAFVGMGLVLLLRESVENVEYILLPIAAGNLLYIAGSDLIPELHKESRMRNAAWQLVTLLCGIGVMLALSQVVDVHAHDEAEGHSEELIDNHVDQDEAEPQQVRVEFIPSK